jgi:tripartite-type tricarboxylate transporter receptor subunit TctC
MVLASLLALACAGTLAQTYPDREVKLVVPFTPGGANDAVARIFATELGQRLGKSFVVENRPGAGGSIGATFVASSPADGYTLLLGANAVLVVNPLIYPKIAYGPDSFVPIGMAAEVPIMLVANPSLPVKTLKELISYAKQSPGKLNYASPGRGTQMHLLAELFKAQAGVEITHVPYKGSAPAVTDLIGGEVQIMFDNVNSSLPHIRAGKLRAIAVNSAKRLDSLPDVPTVAEAGMPAITSAAWFSIMAPAGTPQPVLVRLRKAMSETLKDPATRQRLAGLGAEISAVQPDQTSKFIESERARWTKIVKQADIKAE